MTLVRFPRPKLRSPVIPLGALLALALALPVPAVAQIEVTAPPDLDNDGYVTPVDCNEGDPAINPGAQDIPGNGIDEDCSGADAPIDADKDGYGPPADCNDGDPAIRPGAPDTPGNGIDEDCSGADAPIDNDSDGYGFPADCNDSDPAIHPAAADPPGNGIDENCDGSDSPQASIAQLDFLSPFPIVRLRGDLTRRGAVIRLLAVTAPGGANVRVRCRGRSCPRRSTQTRSARAGRSVRFTKFHRYLRAGTVLEVSVTKEGTIGKYVRLTIRRGRAPGRWDSCLVPGSAKPTKCPSS